MAKYINSYDPTDIAKELEKSKSIDVSGNVSFHGFIHSDYSAVLNSMVELNSSIPKKEKKRIISKASFNSGRKGKITSSSLLKEMTILESEYLKQPINNYRLLTSISIDQSIPIKRSIIDGCTITIKNFLDKRFYRSLESIRRFTIDSESMNIPSNYKIVVVSVKAKSTHEAAEKALNAFDLLRAIWNFYINKNHPIRISGGKRKPVNEILPGPIHTLHIPNGKLATEAWWYEPDYIHKTFGYKPRNNVMSMHNFEKKVRGLISKSSYAAEIKSAFVRYVRALDSVRWESSFLNLWSILEKLTGTTSSDNYKTTVRRASFVFKGDHYARQVLMHLKNIRNEYVHTGTDASDIETVIYQLKRFVEALIGFHLGNKYRFKSIHESAKFLDLPCSKDDLNEKANMILYAKKFLQIDK